MRTILVLFALLIMAGAASAYENRGGAGTPWIPPDASLKTTDPFYQGMMERQYGTPMPSNDPWVGIPEAHVNTTAPSGDPWMNLDSHNAKVGNLHFVVTDAYGMTEGQLQAAGVPLGKEGWL